jgi:hypothetical protein
MIIWSGLGILVPIAAVFCLMTAYYLVVTVTGSDFYWDAHTWPYGGALLVSAVACWFVGQYFHKRKGKVLLDPATGKEVALKPSHTLFFIPIRWWGPILAIIAAVCFAKEFTGPPANFLKARLYGSTTNAGYKDLNLSVPDLLQFLSDARSKKWKKVSDTDWVLAVDYADGEKMDYSFSIVPELKEDLLLKSVKGKDVNLEGFGVITYTAMLKSLAKEAASSKP